MSPDSPKLLPTLLPALLLGLWAIPFAAFMADDFILLGALERVTPATWSGPATLYTIADGVSDHVRAMKDVGAFPWFFEDNYKMRFLRPLSSLLLSLDHAVFGLHPQGYVASSVVWYLLLILGAGLVLRRTCPTSMQRLALTIFAVSSVHQGISWTATRHVTVAAAISLLSFAAWLRWRPRQEAIPRVGFLALALVGFTLALLAGESALGVLAYVVAWEIWGRDRPRPLALLILSPLILAWILAYGWMGFGTRTSGYLDPIHQPLSFLLELPGRFLFIAGGLMSGGNSDLWVVAPPLRLPLIVAAAFLLLGMAWVLRVATTFLEPMECRQVRAWIAGTLLSMIPFTGTPIGARCLMVPMVGAAVVVSAILHVWWTRTRHTHGRRLFGLIAGALAVIHLGFGPIQRLGAPILFREMMWGRVAGASSALTLTHEEVLDRRVVVLQAPDLFIGFHTYFYRRLFHLPMPDSWWTLSFAPCTHHFAREAPDTIRMDLDGCSIQAPTLQTGDRVELHGMEATILDATSDGPRSVAFRFDVPLDSDDILFLRWEEGAFQRVGAP